MTIENFSLEEDLINGIPLCQHIYNNMLTCSNEYGLLGTIESFEIKIAEYNGTDIYNEMMVAVEKFKMDHPIH